MVLKNSEVCVSKILYGEALEFASDNLKLVMLYFIHLSLFSHKNDYPIHKSNFNLVDSRVYNIISWNLTVFKETVKLMHKKF